MIIPTLPSSDLRPPTFNFRLPTSDFRCPLTPVDPLTRRPAGSRHREILDPARAVRILIDQGMRQKSLVVAGRKVGSLVRAARFLTSHGTVDDGLRHIQHEGKLQNRR